MCWAFYAESHIEEGTMWVVEVNVKGRRFTHTVLGANERLREAARGVQDRMTQLRNRVTH
jgi:cell division protein ZapA (FtsZ GTPase activity inhibitor)